MPSANDKAKIRSYVGIYEPRVFLIALVLSLIARASALVSLTFNVDDLWYWPARFDYHVGQIALTEGRFLLAPLAWFEDALGINASHAFTLATVSLTLCMVLSALLVCRLWRIEGDFIASLIVSSMIVLHPYQTDYWTWKISELNGGLPFVLALAALIIAPRSRRSFVLAVAIIVSAFGIHQLPLAFCSVALLMAVPIALTAGTMDWNKWIKQCAALVTGSVAYVVVAKLAIAHSEHLSSLGRDSIIVFSNPWLVVRRVRELASLMVFHDPVIGWLSRVLFATLCILTIVVMIVRRGVSIRARWSLASMFLLAISASFVCSVALIAVPYAWIPVLRNAVSVGLLWAAVPLMAYLLTHGVTRKIIGGVVALLSFSFAGADNGILSNQQRSNLRDVSLMNRIASDVDHLSTYRNIHRIIFIGTNTSPLVNIDTGGDLSEGWHSYGMTLSVFAVTWPGYKTALYNELTGSRMAYDATKDELAAASSVCSEKSWPDAGSVWSTGDMAIVCLGPASIEKVGPLDN
jgi:hypothetical protein